MLAVKYSAKTVLKAGTSGFTVPRPFQKSIGAKVSITCLDDRSRVTYYGSDDCDDTGEFNVIVKKFINGKELNVNGCSVRLVSSPDQTCDSLTNFGGGKTGVKLIRPSSVFRELVKFTVGPFYFTPPMCEQPDTEEPET